MMVLTGAAAFAQRSKIDDRLVELVASSNAQKARGNAEAEVMDTAAIRRDISVTFNGDGTVCTISAIGILRSGAACPVEALRRTGITVKSVVGCMVVMEMPAESLAALEGIDEIQNVVADNVNRIMNDKARDASDIDDAIAGDAEWLVDKGLPHTYTGKGVVIGVIDSGIDYNHAAFRDGNGNTRIKKVVDYGSGEKAVYTESADIEALTTDNTEESHGSHTSCTAGGSMVGETGLHGMAPEADLVLCGLGSSLSDARIIECIGEIFSYAAEVDKPLVLNMSLGENLYFHDGESSAIVKTIKSLNECGEARGRIVCCSAGNEAGRHMTIVQTLGEAGSDGYSLRTVLGESGTTTSGDIEMPYYQSPRLFVYERDGGDFTVELKAVDITTGEIYSLKDKPLYSATDSEKAITNLALTRYTDAITGKKYSRLSKSSIYYFHEANLRLALLVTADADKEMRLLNGVFAGANSATSGFYSKGLEGFTEGGDELTGNVLICDDAVIGVGAYTSRTSWTSISNRKYSYSQPSLRTEGSLTSFTSYCTDDNGVNRPDVVAPGALVLSAFNLYDETRFANGEPISGAEAFVSANELLNERNNYYGMMMGTSMASPCMAGIVALWLQADPSLTTSDVRALLQTTCYNDEYTTNTENIPSADLRQAGAGKADALAGLQAVQDAATTLTLYDGDLYTQPSDKTYADGVTYTRSFSTAGLWYALYVPFPINIEEYADELDIAEIFAFCPIYDSNNDGEVTADDDDYLIVFKKTSGTTLPNKPYLIRMKSVTSCSIASADNTAYAASEGSVECATTKKAYTVTGKYTPTEIVANDGQYYVSTKGSLSHLTKGSLTMRPYRWVMTSADSGEGYDSTESLSKDSYRIVVIGENIDEATAISAVRAFPDSPRAARALYNLSGMRVCEDNTPAGIYVSGGKVKIGK